MKVPITLIILLILGVGAFLYYEDALFSSEPQTEEAVRADEEHEMVHEEDDYEICIQVITPARNPETGELKEFPTPCDVPEGWEEIQPEGLDLQVI